MRPIVLRFVTMLVLFAGWIGYLSYLVYTLPPKSVNGLPMILSRPQFLISELDVVGEIDAKDRTLSAVELLYLELDVERDAKAVSDAGFVGLWTAPMGCGWAPLGAAAVAAPPDAFTFRGVKVTKVLYESEDIKEKVYPPDYPLKPGFVLAVNFARSGITLPTTLGPCILPLRRHMDPRTGEIESSTWDVTPIPPSPGFLASPPRIYPANAETLAQYQQIKKP